MELGSGVRLARPVDLALLPAIETAADEVFAAEGIGPLPPAAGVAELRSAAVVLVAGDPVVGFARLEEVDGAAHLEQLSVHPAAARRGVGSALLASAVAWATQAGYDAMTLCTFADVAWNAPFYARHGFEPVDPAGVMPGLMPGLTPGLTPGLAALRETERRLGLDALGERVVLRLSLR